MSWRFLPTRKKYIPEKQWNNKRAAFAGSLWKNSRRVRHVLTDDCRGIIFPQVLVRDGAIVGAGNTGFSQRWLIFLSIYTDNRWKGYASLRIRMQGVHEGF